MSIIIISSSQRLDSQSFKVSNYIQKNLKTDFEVDSTIIDLAQIQLPMWTDHKNSKEIQEKAWQKIKPILKDAFGYVIVTPEWSGGITPALKNFFLYCTDQELTDKPAYLVSVTASYTGGNLPLAELRQSCFKNTQICYIPEQMIIRSVKHVLNDPNPNTDEDSYTRARLQYGLNIFLHYVSCLINIREESIRDLKNFPYGM
tara:strand:- start:4150 stop:4755 length:606 start_codon:yes stop_codon:yes gene_type:complete